MQESNTLVFFVNLYQLARSCYSASRTHCPYDTATCDFLSFPHTQFMAVKMEKLSYAFNLLQIFKTTIDQCFKFKEDCSFKT